MVVSHSRIECFESCPYKYDLRYNQKIETLPPDNADNALFLGTAMHTGIQQDIETAIREYFSQYTCITDAHINEQIKLEAMIPKAKAMIPDDGEAEIKIEDDDFIGFIDWLAPARTEQKLNGEHQVIPNVYDMYDFKYSNNASHYKESPQLHLYKYFFERSNPGKIIRNMFFLVIPKVNIKQKKTEDIFQFRRRIQEELETKQPQLIPIEYDQDKVIEFLLHTKGVLEATEFPKNPNWLCNYCDYQEYCQKGNDFMNLPSSERRQVGQTTKRKLWIYGAAFSGKTTLVDAAPTPLNLNTDGNIQYVTMPYLSIKDEVTVKGRMTEKVLAWQVFKNTIDELEKKQNDFQTIVVDLLEDTYESCRLYMYDQMGITHESDDSFKAWDKVRTEFLSTIRRLTNLDYENIILISHEDVSKDIMKKSGDKVTRIAPNIADKVANKVAGMVDIVARVVVEDDGSRTLNFKSNEVIFGGGRLKNISKTQIPLDWNALMDLYDEVNGVSDTPSQKPQEATQKPSRRKTENSTHATIEAENEPQTEADKASDEPMNPPVEDEAPTTVDQNTGEVNEPVKQEEAPKARIRKRRG